MGHKVYVAGNLILDIIKMIEKYPEKSMLATITSIAKSVGGCVPNVAISLKKLDPETEVYACGKLGKDEYGEYIRRQLLAGGVDLAHVITDDGVATSFTDVMTETGGARTFFQFRGANARFGAEDIPLDRLQGDLFHIGYALLLDRLDEEDDEYGTKMARLLCAVQKRGLKTSLDVVSDASARFRTVVAPAVRYCDYVILNETEAGFVTEIEPRNGDGSIDLAQLEKILRGFLALGVREKVVVHCPEVGVSMRAGKGKMTVVPSLNLPKGYIKGTVGAGDAFCAGVLYAALMGKSDEEALRIASCAAAANLSVPDSVSGITSYAEVMKLEEKYGRNQI